MVREKDLNCLNGHVPWARQHEKSQVWPCLFYEVFVNAAFSAGFHKSVCILYQKKLHLSFAEVLVMPKCPVGISWDSSSIFWCRLSGTTSL